MIIDLRGIGDPRRLASRGKAPVNFARNAAAVDRIVLHQWGTKVTIGRRGRARIAAGLSISAEELSRRGLGAPYHVDAGVFDGDPFVAHVWPTDVYTYASNGQNRQSVGVGIFGKFPRLERRWSRLRGHTAMDDAIAEAGRMAIEVAAGECTVAQGFPLPPLLLTHSQLTDDRGADPGEFAIRAMVAPLVGAGVIRVLPDYSEDGGDPWPEEWRRHVAEL